MRSAASVVHRPQLFCAVLILGALFGVLQGISASAAPNVFSLDRLRLGSSSGPENYLFTAGNVVYPEGGVDAGALYYKVVVTDGAGAIRNPGFPCTPTAAFPSTDNTYTIATTDPVSTNLSWRLTLQQFSNASCTGTPAKTAFKAFNVAKLTSWADSGLTIPRTVFGPGSSAYVTVAGMKASTSNWTTTWLTPLFSTACANTAGSDRPDASGSGRLPSQAGSFLQYMPGTGSANAQWNRVSNYEIRPCLGLGAGNEGLWSVRLETSPTVFVVLPAFTVDATPPPIPSITSGPPNPSNSSSGQFTFSDAEQGVSFLCQLDGGAASACTSPYPFSGLADGAHSFQVRARDAAGNESAAASYGWTIDTTPPETAIDSGPIGTVGSAEATFTFSSEAGAVFQCELDGGGFAACTSPKTYTGLGEGAHAFRVRARDAAGNLDPTPASRSWTVDTVVPPTPSIDSVPPDPSGSTEATFGFSDSEQGVGFRCRLDGGGFTACASPKTYTGLAEGAHSFLVRAVDGAGNESAAAGHSWTITLLPLVTLVNPPDDSVTNDPTPTFNGSAGIRPTDSPTVTVKVYAGSDTGGPLVQTLVTIRDAAGAWSVDASPALPDGTYTARAQQADLSGNLGFSSANTFTVTANDITPPVVVLTTPANGLLTNDSTPTFAGTAGTDAGDLPTVTVKVYQGSNLIQTRSTSADVAGNFSVDASPALADGTYRAQAEQSDASGNVGRSAEHTFTVDTAPPNTTIESGPSGPISSTVATFTFSSEAGASFQCELDGGGFATCTSPKTYSGLSEGAHTFAVRARDGAGNLDPTPAIRDWTVDTVAPPAPTIDSRPPNPSPTNTATFAFSDTESGVTLRCRLDGAPFASCTSPKTYSGLSEGQHTFEVVAVDPAGNSSGAALYTWMVDTGIPNITLTSPPNNSTIGDATPRFAGIAGTAAGDSTTVTVKVYSGPLPTGTPVRTLNTTRGADGAYSVEPGEPLSKGVYTAQAEQVDSAGHTRLSSPATFTLSSPAYRREVLADSPRAYYRLGELVGTLAVDETGTNPGTFVNGVSLGQGGGLTTTTNTAASFDAVNDYVVVPHSTSLNATTGVTVEAWAKRTTSGLWQVVVSKPGNGLSRLENYSIWFNTLNRPVAFFGDGVSFARVDGPVLDTGWHYLVATYDNATARIYVDGALMASTASTVQMTANTLPLNIGRTNGNSNFFGGTIDEVAIYGTPLSAARIQAHYDAATTFDATPPSVTLTAPANGQRIADTTPTFSGTAGVAGGDSSTVIVNVYPGSSPTGTPVQTLNATRGAGGAYSVDASSALPEGTYTARAQQTDDADNVGFSTANTFVIAFGDITPPVVTLTSPPDGSSTNDMTPTFSGVGGTALGDSATVTIKIYAGRVAAGTPVQTLTATRDGTTGAYAVDSAFLEAFTYTARAEQSDSAGNVGLSAPTTFTVLSAYRAAVLADSPRAYWRLGESSGTTAADETGVNPATYNTVGLGSTSGLTGDRNTAASFDGLTSYVIAPDSNSLDATTGVTVEAWIKRTRGGVWQEVVGKAGDGASKNENYSIWISPFDRAVGFFGNGTTFARVETAPLDTNWHYIVATYDNTTAKIYKDGVLQASIASTVNLTPNSLPLNMGRINAGGSFYGGLLDEVAIYGTALTTSQIEGHFNAANLFDTTPPIVTLSTPDQGTSTKDSTPAFAGMAATGSRDSATITVRVYAGPSPTGNPIQTLSAGRFPTGVWGVSAASALTNGTYTAQAAQTDIAGNVGLSPARTFAVQTNPPFSPDPVMVGAGDIGDCETPSDDNVGLLLNSFPNAVVYTLGDNAYPTGTLAQFNNCFHPAWGVHAQARIRPAIGGHEYLTPQAAGYTTYYANQLAPFGPTASDWTKAYYSYDLGTWHVLVLNTECLDEPACSVPGQLAWARADLDAHPAACTLAILPNPRYSSGDVHGSNAGIQPFWDLLNAKGVDVAVAADDHIYERFAPQNSLGVYDPANGVRQFISGTGGSSHYGFAIIRENSEVRENQTFGLLKFTLHSGSYEWEFVPEPGFSFTDSGSAACH